MKREEKIRSFREIKNIMKKYKTIAIVDMLKMPGRELHNIREMLKEKAKIKMLPKTFLLSVLPFQLSKYAKKAHVPAIILSNDDPFRLFRFLKENRVSAKAKPNDIATNDILINPMPTPLQPGPAITKLQNVGLKTAIEGGKVVIKEGKVVTKKGEKITQDVAEVLNMLGIEPLKIGLNIVAAYHHDIIYEKDVLDIDETEYVNNLHECINNMIKISLKVHYSVPETIKIMLINALRDCLSICINSNVYEKDFIKEHIKKAYLNVCLLNSKIGGET